MFERVERDGVAIHTDPSLFENAGIGVAFSERNGGVSGVPFDSLDLAGHVGDAPRSVDRNRSILLESIGIAALADRLTTAEQVHGTGIAEVTPGIIGSGALVSGGRAAVPGADALWTRERGVPLMLMFADCVPVILARPSVPAIAVVHAGWRGAAAGIVGAAARDVVREADPGVDHLDDVHEGRVQALVFQDGYRVAGYRCQGCGYVTTIETKACPYCGGEFAQIPDAVEMAVRKVMQDGGEVEVLHMVNQFLGGVPLSEETLALDLIDRVGPGGHYLQEDHTLKHFRSVWYSKLFDRSIYARSAEEEGGARGFEERLRQQTLKVMDHQPAPLPAEVVRELEEMARHWQ